MRIITGAAKGRKLRAPRGTTTRPTLGRARTALFDILAPHLPGARFLDLFAGTGAIGLEALSRGAAAAVFVEVSHPAVVALRANLQHLDLAGRARVLPLPALPALARLVAQNETFDIIFSDPPYQRRGNQQVLAGITRRPALLAPAGIVIAQQHHKEPDPATEYFTAFRERRIGDTRFIFFRRSSETYSNIETPSCAPPSTPAVSTPSPMDM